MGSSLGNIFGPRVTGIYVDKDPVAFAWCVLTVSIIALISKEKLS